ncbi:MAG: PD-(D/E)XK nuclease family protein [Eubacterium sp.]|nr:PD-(D/E)XK nuclease family protein [Eubacterium sp.]
MLQLVLGRAGSGKTEYIFQTVRRLVEEGEKNLLLIVPEQFSFISEKRLLTDLGEAKVNEVAYASFSRLAEEILKQHGGDSLPSLSAGAKAVLMKQAIEAVQDQLTLFEHHLFTPSFIQSVISIYDEMKSCRVSVEDILSAGENTEKELLSRKLGDIALMIGAYDALLQDTYYDPANELTRLYHQLLKMDYFTDRTVLIDGFSGFVAQEYKILEVILKQAKKVYITFCTDSYTNTDRYDLFSYVNANIAILKGVAREQGCELLPPILLQKNYRANDAALAAAEQYTFSDVLEEFPDEPSAIRLYSAKNVTDECDRTALEIAKLLRSGYRAGEITVICRDMTLYERELRFAFQKYRIPYFDDERQPVNTQPLMMFVSFLLRAVMYSYRSEDIFSMLKTGLTGLDDSRINALENYCYLWSINGAAWKTEFTRSTKGFTEEISENDKEQLQQLNASRSYVMQILHSFSAACRHATVKKICEALYKTLIRFSCDKQLLLLAQGLEKNGKTALAMEQGRIWDMLMELLDKLVLVSGDKPCTVKEFYQLFSLMLANEDLGTVPVGLDNVQLGSADRIRCDNPLAVFIVGANEGEFPKSVVSAGLLTENDRITLINNHFKLYSYGAALNAQERYFAYMAVASAREKLYVSYRGGADSAGESAIVRGLRAVFPHLTTQVYSDRVTLDRLETKDNAFDLLAAGYGDGDVFIASLGRYFEEEPAYAGRLNAVKNLTANHDIVITDRRLSTALFKKNMYLSASRIEDYYNCAFRYFCKFGLGARPRQKAQMDPMQTGTVIHYVLEQVIKEKGSRGLSALDDEVISLLVNTYLTDYLTTKMGDAEQFTPRFKYQFMRLSKMLVSVLQRLRDEFAQSDFEARAFELTIGDGSNGESVASRKLILPDGGTIEIKGAIDRVDVYTEQDVQYVRVVDYKSGTKEFNLSDIMNGLNLQMFIYLFTLCRSESELAGVESGVLYMHSARKMFSLDRNSGADAVGKETDKLYKMKGLVLNDDDYEIAKHMEHDLRGKYIPVKYVKSKHAVTGNMATLADLGRLSQKIDQLISDMGVSLHNGEIFQRPINGKNHDKTCEFCDYRDVCRNRKEVTSREMKEMTNDEVFAALKEEFDDKVDN